MDCIKFVCSVKVYGVPGLTWSNELAELARTWAVKLAVRGRILYPELSEVGENIHLITSNDTRILDAAHTHPPTVGSGETCTGDHLITGMVSIFNFPAA
jgi:hypothetical protein